MTQVRPTLDPAMTAFQAGDFAAVERLVRPRLASRPDDPRLMALLAISLQELGDWAQALPLFERLAEHDPAIPEHWNNLGNALRAVGRPLDAEHAYQRAIALRPRDPGFRINLGLLLSEAGDVAGARLALLDAFDLDPSSVDARIYGALACFECGDARSAERLVEGHAAWATQLPLEPLLDLCRTVQQLGRIDEAEAMLVRAEAIDPGNPVVAVRRVLMFERLNRLDEARAVARTLPDPAGLADQKLASEIVNAHAALAARDRDATQSRVLLEGLAASAGDSAQIRAGVLFSLAKACDKLGDVEATMTALAGAHAAQLETARALVPEMLAEGAEPLSTATVSVTPEQFARWPRGDGPDAMASPVFIMGFPRSGTTLLEQMLDAHADFQSMDERTFLQGVSERMQAMGLSHPQQLGELTDAQADELRAVYWEQVATAVDLAPGRRLVDKNPLNMLRLPLVNRLFPEAPIILALRHPCDVLLSNYMQHFRSPAFMVLCSTLERLARSYANAMKFWIHHERLLGPNVFHLRYEAMLDDFDGHVARLGDFLGLDDPRGMLGFQERAREKGFISTPSYAQVIEPLNKSSVDRWRRYEPYFADALPILRPAMEHWGYAP
jgi:Flp pilus assembly protein TadD